MMARAERRIEERSDCAIEAKIELNDRLVVTVTVRDISTSGVKLQVASGIHLPDDFDLLVQVVEDVEQRFRVRVGWRNGDMIGGEFVQPSGPATDAINAMNEAIASDRAKQAPDK